LRSIANLTHYLVWGAVTASAVYRREGAQALKDAVDNTSEEFMWTISKIFFADVLPAAGFGDLGDLMEVGMRGMFADYFTVKGEEQMEGETAVRQTMFRNCQLAGIFMAVSKWTGLHPLAIGYAICRYDEAHGLATMLLTMPPMVTPEYKMLASFAMHDQPCVYELKMIPADDMDRLIKAQERVFGVQE
jgi:hypothetical protein